MGDDLASLSEEKPGAVMIVRGKRLGLIVNPKAGLGGSVGLKGSDGEEIQRRALALGAVPKALDRAREALHALASFRDKLEIITYPGEMGADAAAACGFEPMVIGAITTGETTAADTCRAASEMASLGIDLILFAGGDGTARDICRAVGTDIAVLGIPAGVKIHSAVYATSPKHAGELAATYLQEQATQWREAEVMDIDEQAVRQGIVSARLYGYLKIPFQRLLVQSPKSASPPREQLVADEIAHVVIDQMVEDWIYILGPGTTTRAITSRLGLVKTLLGVDVILNRKMLAADVNEKQLLKLLKGPRAKIVVTPIGGQGYLFGRGNQQISAEVIQRVGKENIIAVSTLDKIISLRGRSFLVDTGSHAVDEMLEGYIRVVTGYNEYTVYQITR